MMISYYVSYFLIYTIQPTLHVVCIKNSNSVSSNKKTTNHSNNLDAGQDNTKQQPVPNNSDNDDKYNDIQEIKNKLYPKLMKYFWYIVHMGTAAYFQEFDAYCIMTNYLVSTHKDAFFLKQTIDQVVINRANSIFSSWQQVAKQIYSIKSKEEIEKLDKYHMMDYAYRDLDNDQNKMYEYLKRVTSTGFRDLHGFLNFHAMKDGEVVLPKFSIRIDKLNAHINIPRTDFTDHTVSIVCALEVCKFLSAYLCNRPVSPGDNVQDEWKPIIVDKQISIDKEILLKNAGKNITAIPKIYTTVKMLVHIINTSDLAYLNKPISHITKDDLSKIKIQKSHEYKLPVIESQDDLKFEPFFQYMHYCIKKSILKSLGSWEKYHTPLLFDTRTVLLPMFLSNIIKNNNGRFYMPYTPYKAKDSKQVCIFEINYTDGKGYGIASKEVVSVVNIVAEKLKRFSEGLLVVPLEKQMSELHSMYEKNKLEAILKYFNMTHRKNDTMESILKHLPYDVGKLFKPNAPHIRNPFHHNGFRINTITNKIILNNYFYTYEVLYETLNKIM